MFVALLYCLQLKLPINLRKGGAIIYGEIVCNSQHQWWVLGEANEAVVSGSPFFGAPSILGAPPLK